jgi:hypothetical protein
MPNTNTNTDLLTKIERDLRQEARRLLTAANVIRKARKAPLTPQRAPKRRIPRRP